VLARPACALQIAAIVGEWAYVEDMLASMFSQAMGSRLLDNGDLAALRDRTALLTMQELDSIAIRLRIVEVTLIPLVPEALARQWKEIEKSLRARARERNLIAHASWGVHNEYPNDLILQTRDGRYMRYTEHDFADILNRISSVYVATYDFLLRVYEAKRSGSMSPFR
jgi:hypothetical protein